MKTFEECSIEVAAKYEYTQLPKTGMCRCWEAMLMDEIPHIEVINRIRQAAELYAEQWKNICERQLEVLENQREHIAKLDNIIKQKDKGE